MKTQSELGRKNFAMLQIINDSPNNLEDELINLEQMPEYFIDCIYETSYDEMNDEEIQESTEWIKHELNQGMN